MGERIFFTAVLGLVLLMGTTDGNAATWVKNNVDAPNKNVEANYYDSASVKAHAKTLSWTEKFVLTPFGEENYTKHLSQYPECKKNIAQKGNVTHHQLDFEIKSGNYRLVAKRNYNKKNELVCTGNDMGSELDKSWKDIKYRSPMYERYYLFVTKYKLGDI